MKLLLFWICLSVLTTLSSIDAVSSDTEIYDKIPEFSYDFDTEQSKDRYDTRLLSKEIQKEESFNQEAEASCFTEDDIEYRHGQKILRSDPCETCLCIDGEVFCWWKKCGHKHLNNARKLINKRQRKLFSRNKKQKFIKEKHRKRYKKSKKFSNFFQHHSTIKHFDLNENETHYPFESSILSETKSNNRNKSEIISATVLPSMYSEIIRSLDVIKQNEKGKKKISEIHKDKEFISVQSNLNENEENNDHKFPINDIQQREITMNDQRLTDEASPKHYMITSSGNIEKNGILTNENILSQFQNPYTDDDDDDDYLNHNKKLKKIISLKNEKFNLLPYSSSTPSTIHVPFNQQQNINEIKTTTTDPIDDNCIVMGTSYKIGTILPQETGNCLQCICIEGANKGEPPRVTCSPHNCPPLILPDLFDTTGY